MKLLIGVNWGKDRDQTRYMVPSWITAGTAAACDGKPVTIQRIDDRRGIIEATTSSGNCLAGPVSVFERA